MPVPRTSIRSTTVAALVAAIKEKSAVDGIQVVAGWPGNAIERDSVYVAKVSGVVTYPVEMAGRKEREDDFTILLVFMASEVGGEMDDANARVESFYSALEDVLADDQTLDVPGLRSILLSDVEGPNGTLTDEGAVAFITAQVDAESRLS